MKQFPNKDPEEVIVAIFDYTQELDAGESLSSAAVTALVHAGTDAAPSLILDGAAQVASPQVRQGLKLGISGVSYVLRCKAVTSASRTLVLAALLPVRNAHEA